MNWRPPRARAGVITILLCLLALVMGCERSGPVSRQIRGLTGSTTTDQFPLSQIQGIPAWNQLHVFAPYTPVPVVEQKLGFTWKGARRFRLEQRDDIHLAVFVRAQQVVHVEEWRRSEFDCTPALAESPLNPATVLRMDRSQAVPVLGLIPK